MSNLDNNDTSENVTLPCTEIIESNRTSLSPAHHIETEILGYDPSYVNDSLSDSSKAVHCYPDSPISMAESSDSCNTPATRGIKRSSSDLKREKKIPRRKKSNIYEVEHIEDYVEHDGDAFYLVKWKDWSSKHNSWEPRENMNNCDEMIDNYFSSVYGSFKISRQEISLFSMSLLEPGITKEALEILMSSLRKKGQVKYTVPSLRNLSMALGLLISLPESERNSQDLSRVKRDLMLRCFHVKRTRQLKLLQEWEDEINASTLGATTITVENNVDLEGPPENFYYVNEYIPGSGVSIPEDPLVGCSCSQCTEDSCTCLKESGGNFAYRTDGTIQVSSRVPIYECNKLCSCSENCRNRVVQRGSKVKLSIFRTSNECGWGVKALQNIPKGTFICEYVGEVINSEEAEERGRKYDSVGQTYLFDLDYNDGDHCPYTVDAAFLGNISHFINHSCSPNLAVHAVWINCLHPDLPKLALFARKNIQKDDEITFDYMSQAVQPLAPSSNSSTQCKCGSSMCRKYVF